MITKQNQEEEKASKELEDLKKKKEIQLSLRTSSIAASIGLENHQRFNQNQRLYVHYALTRGLNKKQQEILKQYDSNHASKLGELAIWNPCSKDEEKDMMEFWQKRILEFKRNIIEIMGYLHYQFKSTILEEKMKFLLSDDFVEGSTGKFIRQIQFKPYRVSFTLHLPSSIQFEFDYFGLSEKNSQSKKIEKRVNDGIHSNNNTSSNKESERKKNKANHITVTTTLSDFNLTQSQIDEIIPFSQLICFQQGRIFFSKDKNGSFRYHSNVAILNDYLISDILYTIDQHIMLLLCLVDYHQYLRYGKKEINSISLESNRFCLRVKESLLQIHKTRLELISSSSANLDSLLL